MSETTVSRTEAGLRRILLLVVVIGAVGLAAELLLLEHYEEWTQWLPLVVLALVIASALLLWQRPTRHVVQAFRLMMGVVLVTGTAGLVLHFAGNREFELELDGALGGRALAWEALRGATPALAPGALIQLALLGLALTWRHPALDTRGRTNTGDVT